MKKKFTECSLVILFLLLFIYTNNYGQMPPHPSLLEKIKQGELAAPYSLKNLQILRDKGIDAAWSSPGLETPQNLKRNNFSRTLGPQTVPSGNWKALAILVQFTDKASQVNASYFDNLLFGQNTETLHDYYNKVSYGNLDIVTLNLPSAVGWVTAPQTYAYYVNNSNGEGNYPRNTQKLVEDIVNIVNPQIDFSQYDNDGDGYVDALFILHSGPGAEFTGQNYDIWSHSWATSTPQNLDGVKVYRYSIEPEFWENPGDMTCGVFAHELGHALFGLPDLYDRDGTSSGLGNWSLMAGGSWNGPNYLGGSPSFPDAWSHFQMGYVKPTVISANISSKSIKNAEGTPETYFLWNDLCGSEYFLVENRQQTGYDIYLPGNGLCIYHIDNDVTTQNDKEVYPGTYYSNPNWHYLVALEQADGLWDLERRNNRGDSNDPYPGSTNNRTFNSSTKPDSKKYDITESGISVSNISSSSSIMTANLKVEIENPGPQFSEQPLTFLTAVWHSSVAWGDYDNDGYLDILLTGGKDFYSEVSEVYRNNRDGTFSKQTSISLYGVEFSSVAWGDYDNDGYLDILLTGYNIENKYVAKIYRNNGNNKFTEQTSISLASVSGGSSAWGDYDNDGKLDLLLTGGLVNNENVSKIYRNNGDNTFTEQPISLIGVASSSVAWGDYDNDGDLDVLLTGFEYGVNVVSKIFRNNGDNTFSEQSEISLMGVGFGSVAWGDYDNDGDLDILLTGSHSGEGGSGNFSLIYRNNGDNTFTEQTSISITAVNLSSAAWGDYDNDGYLDILITGQPATPISKIYHNNGDNTFSELTSASLAGISDGSVAWGDYDNDGNLDILLTGSFVSKIYHNNNTKKNIAPSTPSNLKTVIYGNDVTFSWNKSSDNETPQNGLTYNLVIGTSPGACNILSPMSDRNTGHRKIVSMGNAGHCNYWTIKGLAPGKYYWSVQGIDNCFAGSKFVDEQSFTIQASGIAITYPKGGEIFAVGSHPVITYNSVGNSGNINLDYSTDGGITWSVIATNTDDDGDWQSWTVPNTPSRKCKIRVSDSDGNPSVISEGLFTIQSPGTIIITYPTGGEVLEIGSNPIITYSSLENSGYINLDYSTDGGISWNVMAANTIDDGDWRSWIVPNTQSTSCKIRVSDSDGNPSVISDGLFMIQPPGAHACVKVFLQGPYSSGSMNTTLNSGGYLQSETASQPYKSVPWNYNGEESVSSDINFFKNHPLIVDWVLVQLRTSTVASSTVATRAAFLKSDGTIVDMDGTSPLDFWGTPDGSYYIVIKHRNHLSVMSASGVSLPNSSGTVYDFTTSQSQAYGTNPMIVLDDAKYGMIAGDANSDGQVTTLDYNSWLPNARSSKTGCCNTDVNLDGLNTTLDYNLWLPNARASRKSQVP